MAKSAIQNPAFSDDEAARAALEAIRWPNGPVCPHCGNLDQQRIAKGGGKVHRPGLYYCAACNGQFTVTVGSVMERSKIPLSKWLMAMHLMASSKKGVSSHQLHRMLGVTYKTAWFLSHRIREAMRSGNLAPMGGPETPVEADETYFGNKDVITKRTRKGKSGHASKRAVVALVERGGSVRSFHVDHATKAAVTEIVATNVAREATLHTDESRLYGAVSGHVAGHFTVRHASDEYRRGDSYTNTVEGVFSIFKRGMKGVYQHCGEAHLHRYLAEFDFRYNSRTALGISDGERAALIAKGIGGKRRTYRPANGNRESTSIH